MTVGALFSPERQNCVNTFDDKLSYRRIPCVTWRKGLTRPNNDFRLV